MLSSSLHSSASAAAGNASRPAIFSIAALAESVNQWCEENGVRPVNGQSAPLLNDRNIRYYRLRGLLDAPGSGAPEGAARRGFTEKHAAQLRVIRLLQARGLPLDRIQVSIAGLSLDELRMLQRREMGKPIGPVAGSSFGDGSDAHGGNGVFGTLARGNRNGSGGADAASEFSQARTAERPSNGVASSDAPATSAPEPALGQEGWLVSAVGEEFLLVSRRGRQITEEQRRLIGAVLRA